MGGKIECGVQIQQYIYYLTTINFILFKFVIGQSGTVKVPPSFVKFSIIQATQIFSLLEVIRILVYVKLNK